MSRGWPVLLLLVPAALLGRRLGLLQLAVFALSAVGLVPLAGLIGRATEALAHHLGPRSGGLLNATFGNAAELIITAFAVHAGLLTLVKASITGSIIGNTLLVLGTASLAGGLRHGEQRFDPRASSVNAAMMILAVSGLYLPAVVATSGPEQPPLEALSLVIAGVLLILYVAYLVYTIVTRGEPAPSQTDEPSGRSPSVTWGLARSVVTLAGATGGAAVGSELLVDSVEAVTQQLGWSEFFVGVILVAIIGNAAEHFSAVQMAWRNRLDVTLGIAAGSSTQIALFVAPLLVFASSGLGHPMDLVFRPAELAIIGLATAIFAYVSLDGRSNWLEGAQLLGVYAVGATTFFFLRA